MSEPLTSSMPVPAEKPVRKPAPAGADRSSKYNVREAIKKLRSLKSADQIRAFTRGEKRTTVKRAIAPALRKFPA